MPTSTAPDAIAEVRAAVQEAISRPPVSSDRSMEWLCRCAVGAPVLACSPEGIPAFWIVPLEIDRYACGYAKADLQARVGQIASLGIGAGQSEGCPDSDFFRRPPDGALKEIRGRYAGMVLGEPLFSYDRTPAKWGWRVTVGLPVVKVVFINPGGWYESHGLDDSAKLIEG